MKYKLEGREARLWREGRGFVNFAITARIKGVITLPRLEEALRKISQKHPKIPLRIILDHEQTWWLTSEGDPTFPIRVVERKTDADWVHALETDYDHLFPPNGPLIRFILVLGPDRSELIVICHHAFYDGLSGAYLLHDIVAYLGDPDQSVIPLPLLPLMSALIPEAVVKAISDQRAVIQPTVDGPVSDASPEFKPFTPEERQIRVLHWSLSIAHTERLIQRCREEQTSVHSAIGVALMMTFAQLKIGHGSTLRRVSSPVSLRSRLTTDVGQGMGNFINSGIICEVDCPPGRDFWDAAREFKTTLRNKATDTVLFSPPGGSRPSYDFSLTNLGLLDFQPVYGNYQLEALFGPGVVGPEREIGIGVLTLNGQMQFTVMWRQGLLPMATVDQLIQKMQSLLQDVIQK